MNCSHSSCSITTNERMITCWLCDDIYHIKCCGLKPRDADALSDDSKSMHWTCPNCKNISIEFYTMFKSTKNEFIKINNEFLELQKKLNAFGKLFTDYPYLEKFASGQGKSSSRKKNKTHTDSASPSVDPNVRQESIAVPDDIPVNSAAIRNNNVHQHIEPPIINIENCLSNTTSLNSLVSANDYASPMSPKSFDYVPLRAIPPKKAVFVSRLAFETSSEDINFFIKSKISMDAEISTYKFNYSQPREIASFKIIVPDQYFNMLLDPNFWPTNTFVREFTARQNSVSTARLPLRKTNVSKN